MKSARSRICLCCEEQFDADRRNARHQKYCSKPTCRKASKAASQRLWSDTPENRNYHSGPDAVMRVRDWQKAHPEFRERQKAKRASALQDHCIVQVPDLKRESAPLPVPAEVPSAPALPALQDFISTQALVFVGLIAHLFHFTLQDDIASTARSLQKLGEDIANGRPPDEFLKTAHLFRAHATGAGAI